MNLFIFIYNIVGIWDYLISFVIKRKITFVPVGGLANRMRVMASAVHLSQETNSQLNVLWFKDWALNAPFSCLFEPINDKTLNLKETSFIGRVLWDRPRKKNYIYLVFFIIYLLRIAFMNVLFFI